MGRSRIYARCDDLCRQIAVINFNWKKGRFVRHPALCILPFLRRTQFYTHFTNNSQSACTVSSLSLLIKGKDLLISKSSSNIVKLIPVKIKLDRIQTPLEKPYMQTSKSYVNHYLNLKKKKCLHNVFSLSKFMAHTPSVT